jgi:cytochrome P450
MIQPAFHKNKIEKLCDEMVLYIHHTLSRWEQSTASGTVKMNISAEMMALTLGIVGKTLLNTDVGGEAKNIGEALSFLLRSVNKRTRTPVLLPVWVPVPEHLKIRKSVKRINAVLDHIFEERRKKPGQRYDLLSMLMESTYEDTGLPMDDRQLRDEVMTIFMAGHETTANALSWTFYLLASHPDVFQKLMDEIFRVTGDRDPEFSDLHSLKYLTMVIEESMRLYPPAWIIGRKSIKADVLGEYTIPPGYNILICAYALHRDKRYWHNPDQFIPERFTQEETQLRPKFSYIPFGGGPRLCIGNSFAMMEMQLAVVMVLKRFRPELLPETDNAMEPLITLRPEKGIILKIKHQPQTQNSAVGN